MRTPKRLYTEERLIYHPELLTCPHCGDVLVMCNYLAWDKTVQTLDRVLSVASRLGRYPRTTYLGSRMRLLSATAQRLTLPGSTYGYDVPVRIAWWRCKSTAPKSLRTRRRGCPRPMPRAGLTLGHASPILRHLGSFGVAVP
jgi:hypothetical protein